MCSFLNGFSIVNPNATIQGYEFCIVSFPPTRNRKGEKSNGLMPHSCDEDDGGGVTSLDFSFLQQTNDERKLKINDFLVKLKVPGKNI